MPSAIPTNPVLRPYITQGRVNYEQLRNEDWLPPVIAYIEQAEVEEMDQQEAKAFWLNAYNIITIKAVLEKLQTNPDWAGVTSQWRKIKFFWWKKHLIAGRKMSLYYLENTIIRQEFQDPRIHFALNCASRSCPYLPEKLFHAKTLDEQLNQLTADFINQQHAVLLEDDRLQISEIFKMYPNDFGGQDQVIPFIRAYWQGPSIPQNSKISYLPYDWSLNRAERL